MDNLANLVGRSMTGLNQIDWSQIAGAGLVSAVLYFDANGVIAGASGVGVLSSDGTLIQFQTINLNDLDTSSLTANTLLQANGSKQITSSVVTTTVAGYLVNITSDVQAQIDAIDQSKWEVVGTDLQPIDPANDVKVTTSIDCPTFTNVDNIYMNNGAAFNWSTATIRFKFDTTSVIILHESFADFNIDLRMSNQTASTVPIFDASKNLVSSTISSTILQTALASYDTGAGSIESRLDALEADPNYWEQNDTYDLVGINATNWPTDYYCWLAPYGVLVSGDITPPYTGTAALPEVFNVRGSGYIEKVTETGNVEWKLQNNKADTSYGRLWVNSGNSNLGYAQLFLSHGNVGRLVLEATKNSSTGATERGKLWFNANGVTTSEKVLEYNVFNSSNQGVHLWQIDGTDIASIDSSGITNELTGLNIDSPVYGRMWLYIAAGDSGVAVSSGTNQRPNSAWGSNSRTGLRNVTYVSTGTFPGSFEIDYSGYYMICVNGERTDNNGGIYWGIYKASSNSGGATVSALHLERANTNTAGHSSISTIQQLDAGEIVFVSQETSAGSSDVQLRANSDATYETGQFYIHRIGNTT